jgi:hypothetical protein
VWLGFYPRGIAKNVRSSIRITKVSSFGNCFSHSPRKGISQFINHFSKPVSHFIISFIPSHSLTRNWFSSNQLSDMRFLNISHHLKIMKFLLTKTLRDTHKGTPSSIACHDEQGFCLRFSALRDPRNTHASSIACR